MATRISGTLALLAFALCLILGLRAENSFSVTLGRALLAMVVTLVVGLIAGMMIEKMLQEGTIETDDVSK